MANPFDQFDEVDPFSQFDVRQPEPPQDFSTMEMIKNIPSSYMTGLKGMVSAVTSPIETAQGIGKAITGGASKLAKYSREQGFPIAPEPTQEQMQKYGGYPQEATADAIAQFYKDRYGSGDQFKQTLMKDPVGVMSDVSLALTGGGAAAAKMPGLMGRIGKVAKTAGMAIEPINLAKGIIKSGMSTIPKSLPINLYKSAVKFPTTLDTKYGLGTRTKLAETALKHQIMPTEKGILQLAAFDKELGTRIGGLIDKATETGKSIPVSQVFRHLKEARRSVGGIRVGAQKHLKQIDDIAKELTQQIKASKAKSLSPRQLQDLKISAQAAAKYEPGTTSLPGKEAGSKAIALGAKESIEQLVPEAIAINKELSALKKLKQPLSQSAARIENRDLISLGAPVKVMAGAEAAGGRGAVAGFLAGMVESKKAQLALKLKRIQDAGLGNLIDQNLIPTLIKQGLWQTGKLEPEDESVR